MTDLSQDAEHHRAKASAMLMSMVPRHQLWARELVEHIEAAAVANVMNLLLLRLERSTVDGPARAAIEQLIRGTDR